MIRTLIVDDEALAREGIRLLLKDEANISIVGEAEDGTEAVDEIKRLLPDLVFLDVQMPSLNGFAVLQRVAGIHLPAVVFVTAHERYAVAAFEARAIDYLLKPFSDERFQRAVQRARQALERTDEIEQNQKRLLDFVESRIKTIPSEPTGVYPRLLTVKHGRVITLVKVDEIDWIDSASNYIQVHTNGHLHLLRMTMGQLEARLDPRRFVRIHRTTIVNIDRVQELSLGYHGDVDVKLRNGTALRSSRGYRERLARVVPV